MMTEKIELKTWDDKIEKAKEAIKESFWGDFLFGGLLVSGIFIFIDSFEFSQYTNRFIGLVLFIAAFILVILRFNYFKVRKIMIKVVIKRAGKYYSDSKPEESLNLLNNLLKNNNNLKIKEIWYNKSLSFSSLGRFDEALESLNYALNVNPYYTLALYEKGSLLQLMNKFEEALELYDKVHTIDENFKDAWYNKATIESKQNNKEKALDYLTRAVLLDPSYAEMAEDDRDFINIKDLEEFKELIELYINF